MDKSAFLRDIIIAALKKEIGDIVVAEVDGFNFSAAEVAVLGENGETEAYRIAVVKHRNQD